MNDRQIRYAHAVWRECSFSKASERLHVSQPSLSDQVRLLERELGFDIFIRSNRGVEATPAGTVFLQEASLVVGGLEELKTFGVDLNGRPGAQFRIGIAPSLTPVLAPAVTARVGSTKGLRLSIFNAGTRRVRRMIRQGRLDLGVTLQGSAETARGELLIERIASVPLVALCARREGAVETIAPIAIGEIATRPLLISDTSVGYGPVLTPLFAERDLKPPVAAYCDDLAAVRRLVRADLGLAVVPALALVDTVADPWTDVRPLEGGLHVDIELVRNSERAPPRVEAQIAAAGAAIRERIVAEVGRAAA